MKHYQFNHSGLLLWAVFALVMPVMSLAGADCTDWNLNKDWNPNIQDRGGVITVYPTGVDDTENLQCAFNSAVARGRKTDLRLVEGTYLTRQIVVEDFHGRFSGAGKHKTIIENCSYETCGLLELIDDQGNDYRFPQDLGTSPADRPWPILIAFIGGDFEVSKMRVSIGGMAPTSNWYLFCFTEDTTNCPYTNDLSQAFGVTGDPENYAVDARFRQVLIRGEPTSAGLYGHNLINGIFYFGLAGGNAVATSGNFTVTDSKFEAVGVGTSFLGLDQARVVLSGNHYLNVIIATDPASINHSEVFFTNNRVKSQQVGIAWDDPSFLFGPAQSEDLKLFVSGNDFEIGLAGILLNAVMSGNPHCLLVDNTFSGGVIDIALAPDTSNCLVVGSGLNINDDGTDNRVIN